MCQQLYISNSILNNYNNQFMATDTFSMDYVYFSNINLVKVDKKELADFSEDT